MFIWEAFKYFYYGREGGRQRSNVVLGKFLDRVMRGLRFLLSTQAHKSA